MSKTQPADVKPLMVIGICTRNRHEMLHRCLISLKNARLPKRYRTELIIVENAETLSIESIIEELNLPIPVHLAAEPKIGYSSVRNRVLDMADEMGADILLGVDDDEEVCENWVIAYEAAAEFLPDCDVMMGPTNLRYANGDEPSSIVQSAGHWIERTQPLKRAFGQRPYVPATMNYALRKAVFSKQSDLGLRFDERFNTIGSEDTAFFFILENLYGGKLGWVPEARAFEDRLGKRDTLKFISERNARNQAAYFSIVLAHQKTQKTLSVALSEIRQTTLKHAFYAFYHFIAAALYALDQPQRAKKLFGTSVCHFKCLGAVTTAFKWRQL